MSRCHSVVVVVACVAAVVEGFVSPSVMGSYRLECNAIRNCDGESSGYEIKHNQVPNNSAPSGCSGEIHLSHGLDDKISGTYTLDMWTDDRWHILASENFTEGCKDALETLPELFTLLQFPASCPVTNGTFHFQQDDVSGITLSHFPKLPFGRFRLAVKILHIYEPVMRGCVLFDVNVVPKDTLQGQV